MEKEEKSGISDYINCISKDAANADKDSASFTASREKCGINVDSFWKEAIGARISQGKGNARCANWAMLLRRENAHVSPDVANKFYKTCRQETTDYCKKHLEVFPTSDSPPIQR